jgi:hypothetical protein
MASSAEGWVIVGADGKPIADIRGNVPVFTSREEAERWLMAGERVQQCAPMNGGSGWRGVHTTPPVAFRRP